MDSTAGVGQDKVSSDHGRSAQLCLSGLVVTLEYYAVRYPGGQSANGAYKTTAELVPGCIRNPAAAVLARRVTFRPATGDAIIREVLGVDV